MRRGPLGFMGEINGWNPLTRNPVCFLGTPSFPRLAFVPQCVPLVVLHLMFGSGPFDLVGVWSVCGPIGRRYPPPLSELTGGRAKCYGKPCGRG